MKKKYSFLIRPILLLIDIVIINTVVYYASEKEYLNAVLYIYISVFWTASSFFTRFYKVHRATPIRKLITLLLSQLSLFSLGYFTYFGIFREGIIIDSQFLILVSVGITISFFKVISFITLKKYRSRGRNYRNVVVFGERTSANNIAKLFDKRQDFGYRVFGFFSDKKSNSKGYLGTIKKGFEYVLENNIDEIYCEVSSLTQQQLKEIRKFVNKNTTVLRLIPEAKGVYSKGFVLEYYGRIPVLKPIPLPFERIETHFVKRSFDIVFSVLVLFLLLSWLIPILWLLIKLESKGPAFFKQEREGINGIQFTCYKFRSMKNHAALEGKHTTKNDKRITKLGAFLRKTSMDELPQFLNVLEGDMSVVGPRPHMNLQSQQFEKEVHNYIKRYAVKPGITGLAQVSGYRGEIKKKSDIENRVRWDLFYIENWSFLLDLKIITQTVFNMFKGEEKAY